MEGVMNCFKIKFNFIYFLNLFCFLFVLLINNSNLYAQFEIKISKSFDDISKCVINCEDIKLSYEGNREFLPNIFFPRFRTYRYNRGNIGCNYNTATCTRLDFYEMTLYGNVNMDSYAYKQEDEWYREWEWDCEGSWQRCWRKKGVLIRPTCNWNSGYGYSESYTIGDLKENIVFVDDAMQRARKYCLSSSYAKECKESCQPSASLYVNGVHVSTIAEFLNALTKEQAVDGLVKKIGTEGMMKYYDPNQIY